MHTAAAVVGMCVPYRDYSRRKKKPFVQLVSEGGRRSVWVCSVKSIT